MQKEEKEEEKAKGEKKKTLSEARISCERTI